MGEPPTPLGAFDDSGPEPLETIQRGALTAAFTAIFNATGQPAISLPLHWSEDGLPIGVQLVAPCGREDVLIRVAAQLERARPWADRLPPVFAGARRRRLSDTGRTMATISGVITAMATPFTEDGALDLEAARRLSRHLVENGSHGLVVAGHHRRVPDPLGRGEAEPPGGGEGGGRRPRDDRLRHGLQRHPPLGRADPAACRRGADAALVVTPYYNKPNRAGLRAHFEAVAEAAGDTAVILYNIPSRCVINLAPAFLAELAAEIPNVTAVKQANDADLGPIEGLDVLAGNDSVFLRCLELGGTGGILVSSHLVGPEMRAMYEAATAGDGARAHELDAELQPIYEATAVTSNPIPVKAALEMLGIDRGPPAAADGPRQPRGAGRDQGGAGAPRPPGRWLVAPLQRPAARRARRDRQEHDRRRVRGADRRGRHRAHVPDHRDAGNRPGASRLLVSSRSRRRDRGDRPHPWSRGPRRGAALRPAGGWDAARDLRRGADHRPGALEARGAPAPRGAPRGAGGRRAGAPRPVRARAGPHVALDSGLSRRRPAHGPRCPADHRRLQVRPDPGGRAAGRRLAARRAGPGGRAVPVRRLDQRRSARGGAVGVERGPGPARSVLPLPRPDHRHLVRLERASGPAGDRRCRRARSTRGAGRSLDAQELQHRRQPRHRAGSRGHADPGAGDRVLPGPQGGGDLDRKPGRAPVRAAAHGPRRPRGRRAALRRHGDLLGDAGPRQRALRERDDRPDLRDRRPGGDRGRRAHPRLGPRMAGGAEADAQPDPAALRDAGSRRSQAPAPPRGPGRVGGDRAGADLQGPQRPGARVRRVRGPARVTRSRPG